MSEYTRTIGYGPATRERQIWQHVKSGERYVVETDGRRIFGAAGPLRHNEITQALAGFDSDPDLVYDLTDTPGDYNLWKGE